MAIGVDVSDCQGVIDWSKVKSTGVEFAFLRTVRGSGKTDYQFENNYKGCQANDILIGGYKYSYATTVEQAKQEAQSVVKLLNGRKLGLPIFFDMEDKSQQGLGKELLTKIANAFMDVIKQAGYMTGIYCNTWWYTSILDTNALKCDYWIAKYGANTSTPGTKPSIKGNEMIGWQYSSRGSIKGIGGNVDLNILYKNYIQGSADQEDKIDLPISVVATPSDFNENVRTLQEALNEEGITDANGNELKIDGLKGTSTKGAIKKVLLTAGKLNTVNGKYQIGSEGVVVQWMQMRLNSLIQDEIVKKLGHELSTDGKYGNDTRVIVGLWQEIAGLAVDFKAGVDTITSLL